MGAKQAVKPIKPSSAKDSISMTEEDIKEIQTCLCGISVHVGFLFISGLDWKTWPGF
jgi:hypothetical protein